MDDEKNIQSMYELASVFQFCEIFGSILQLPVFSAEQLELCIINSDKDPLFEEIIIKLLLRITNKTVNPNTWPKVLKPMIDDRYEQIFETNPFDIPTSTVEKDDFFALSVTTKLLILKALMEWNLEDNEEVLDSLKQNTESIHKLRPTPIGYDSKGNQYWYFGNSSDECTCRIYKELPSKISKYKTEVKGKWEVACTTIDELQILLQSLQNSTNENERKFLQILENELLPSLNNKIKLRERQKRRQVHQDVNTSNIITTTRSRKLRFAYDQATNEYEEEY